MSIDITKHILNRLIEGKPLTPIEDTPDIWNDVTHRFDIKSYQCMRMSSLFKDVSEDGHIDYSDVNRIVFIDKNDPHGCRYLNGFMTNLINKMYPIKMPYYPEDKPFVTYCSDLLFDPKNGDYDTIAIWYVEKPNGSKEDVNRFFKEAGNIFEEITREEFDMRAAVAKARVNNEA